MTLEENFKDINKLEICWVGDGNSPKNYIQCDSGINIYDKEKYYSELTFHYWYWKNILNQNQNGDWFGMCQYRRYFVKSEYKDLIKNIAGKQGYYPYINNFKIWV